MSLKRPRGVWRDHFGDLLVVRWASSRVLGSLLIGLAQASPLSPVPSIADTLSPLGKKPAKQVRILGMQLTILFTPSC
jgi:hypothetical protein